MIDQNLLRTAEALVFRHPGHPSQKVHNPHKGKRAKKGGLPKGKAPDGKITVSDDARKWLLSDVGKGKAEFTKDSIVLSTSSEEKSAYKKRIAQQLAKDTGIPEDLQSDFVRQWAESSNDHRYGSLLTQKEAAEKFGVELSDWQQERFSVVEADRASAMKPKDRWLSPPLRTAHEDLQGELSPGVPKNYKNHQEATRKSIDAMYNHTQEELRGAGVESVILYRGVSAQSGTRSDKVPKEGEVVNVSGNALESWTLNPKTAGSFASGEEGGGGMVLKMEVPVERIVATAKTGFGSLDETEFVIVGGKNMGQARVMNESVIKRAFR